MTQAQGWTHHFTSAFNPPMPSPPFILNLSRPHLRKLPPLDVDVHGQLLKVGWVTCIVLVRFHNFLIGTLVLGLAEISIFSPLYLLISSFCENVESAFFTRMFSLSFVTLIFPPFPSMFSPHSFLSFLWVATLSDFYFRWM